MPHFDLASRSSQLLVAIYSNFLYSAGIPWLMVAGLSGRELARSKLLAKRPHSGGHWAGEKKTETSGKTSGRPREDLRKTYL